MERVKPHRFYAKVIESVVLLFIVHVNSHVWVLHNTSFRLQFSKSAGETGFAARLQGMFPTGSTPGLGVIWGLSLLVLPLARRGFSLGSTGFSV